MKHFTFAKTHKNENSTRTTVLLKLFIEKNQIVGFRFQHYYLEKNRILGQNQGESVFHAVLFITREMTEEQKTKYHFEQDVSQYSLLQNSLEVRSKHNSDKRFAALLDDFKAKLR